MEPDSDEQSGNVRAVVRAINILKSFEDSKGPMSVAEIQKKVGLSRPTLYRLLDTLVATDMLSCEGEPQRFRLGRVAARLGQLWAAQFEVDALARPIIEELRDSIGESCGLFKLQNGLQYCILEAKSRYPLAMTRGIGELADGFQGASGKAILAWLPRNEAMEIIQKTAEYSAHPITHDELDKILANGYALSKEAVIKGATAIAAPVFDHSNHIFGSLAIFGPEVRLRDAQLEQAKAAIIQAAREISIQFGANL